MKVSTVLSNAIFLAFVFSQTLFAANAPTGTQDSRKMPTAATPPVTSKRAVNLPPVLKINSSDINMNAVLIDSNMQSAYRAKECIKENSEDISHHYLMLHKSISDYRNKANECKNKAYTLEDMKNAGCVANNLSVTQCSKQLFYMCVSKEKAEIQKESSGLGDAGWAAESCAKELRKNAHSIINTTYQ